MHLVFFTQACIRNPDPTVPAVAGAELGNMPSKPEANVAQQPYPAQQYPAQPYPAQQQYPVQYPAQTYPQQPYPPQQQPYGQPPYSQ